ncbi:MAG TPA: nucleotidyl transferase AbiEii/AbiGii toxin family protein [Holophaga sp.]|nr:nucleotidyl transferase AbiEii/AbiGii toxin family protein [Holophaga sp.]
MKPISLPEGRRLDAVLVRILAEVDAAAKALGAPYLLTGAMAREILLAFAHGLPHGRVTNDVDFGIQVADWDAFEAFKQALLDGAGFRADPVIPHRIYTREGAFGLQVPVDLVPFGPLESPQGVIKWPPGRDVVMDVRGFRVGLDHIQPIEVEPGFTIPIPAVEAMILMKVLAWKDRGAATRGRDAVDLVELLEHGEDLIGLDVLYEAHLDAVERNGGDPRLAGAEILGRRAWKCAPRDLALEVLGILQEGLAADLVIQVLSGTGGMGGSRRADAITALLQACAKGMSGPGHDAEA